MNMYRFRLAPLLLMLASFFLSGTALSAPADIGLVTGVQGTVTVTRHSGASMPAIAGLAVQAGDRFVAGSDGVIRFRLGEHNSFILSRDSALVVDRLILYDPQRRPILVLQYGHLHAEHPRKSNLLDITLPMVYAPNAVIHSRRAWFDVAVALDSTTAIHDVEGWVDVETESTWLTLLENRLLEIPPAGIPGEAVVRDAGSVDLEQWRREREEKLAASLPEIIPYLQESAVLFAAGIDEYTGYMEETAGRLEEPLGELIRALRRKQRWGPELARRVRHVQIMRRKFRQRTYWFRGELNRLMVLAGLSEALAEQVAGAGREAEPAGLQWIRSNESLRIDDPRSRVGGRLEDAFTVLRRINAMNEDLEQARSAYSSEYQYNIKVIEIRRHEQ